MSYQVKELLSASVVKKSSKLDPEKILYDHLYPKFGERFVEYRKKYEKYLNNNDYKYEFPYPISVILELVNRCNLECTMCYQGYRNDSKKHTLSEDDLEKIFIDFEKNQLDALLLSASEPLLYKKIDYVLKLAEKSKIMDIFLFTNGTLLNEKKNKILLNSSITRLFVSLDAATNTTYEKVRIPVSKNIQSINRLDMIENNIKNFVKMRNEMGKKLPLVRVSFVALKDNSHEINKFIDKWINVVDTVEIQRENSIKLYDTIHKLKDQNLEGKVFFKKKEYHCNEPWGQVTINSDGSVGPCCNTVGRNIEIGNVLKNSLSDIWRGNEMNKIRNGFKSNEPNQICKLCLEHEQINY